MAVWRKHRTAQFGNHLKREHQKKETERKAKQLYRQRIAQLKKGRK